MTGATDSAANTAMSDGRPHWMRSVKTGLIASLALVLIVAIFFGGLLFRQAWEERKAAALQVTLNKVQDDITSAIAGLAMESAALQMMLAYGDRPDSTVEELAKAAGGRYRQAMERFLTDANRLPSFAGVTELVGQLTDNAKSYRELKADVGRVLASGQRPGRLGRKLASAADSHMSLLRAVADRLSVTYPAIDSRVIANVKLKNSLSVMEEYSAREWAVVGRVMAAGQTLTSYETRMIATLGGHVERAWADVVTLLDAGRLPVELGQMTAQIQQRFFFDFAQLRDRLYLAAETGAASPVAPGDWLQAAASSLEPVHAMVDRAGELASADAAQRVDKANIAMVRAALLLSFSIVASVMAAFVVFARIALPLLALDGAMRELARDNLETDIPGVRRRDEIGSMARSVLTFRDNALERRRLRAEQKAASEERRKREAESEMLERQKADDKKREAERIRKETESRKRRAEQIALAARFERDILALVSQLAELAHELEHTAGFLDQSAGRVANRCEAVAQAVEQTAKSQHMVAGATKELSAAARLIAERTADSSTAAQTAGAQALSAGNDVQELVSSASEIGDVVDLIGDIARKTNLLALNASIEAARAGGAGKGFAVVAQEVRALAGQSGQATSDIVNQVEAMRKATGQVEQATTLICEIVHNIGESSLSIAASVRQQDNSTSDIANTVAKMREQSQTITSDMALLREESAGAGNAAKTMLASCRRLSASFDDLGLQVQDFLEKIRATD